LPAHPRVLTADWTYLRFHGASQPPYSGTYSDTQLTNEARWVARQLRDGLDVYAYFNNDVGGHAVRDAIRLRGMVADALRHGRAGSHARSA
jgi:uncharacterized protein YecE (DUF72 family)